VTNPETNESRELRRETEMKDTMMKNRKLKREENIMY
jgi:hypothetical protein